MGVLCLLRRVGDFDFDIRLRLVGDFVLDLDLDLRRTGDFDFEYFLLRTGDLDFDFDTERLLLLRVGLAATGDLDRLRLLTGDFAILIDLDLDFDRLRRLTGDLAIVIDLDLDLDRLRLLVGDATTADDFDFDRLRLRGDTATTAHVFDFDPERDLDLLRRAGLFAGDLDLETERLRLLRVGLITGLVATIGGVITTTGDLDLETRLAGDFERERLLVGDRTIRFVTIISL